MENKELMTIIEKYSLGEIVPVTGTQRSEKYKYFFWWRLIFNEEFNENTKSPLKEKFKEYEGIHFMPYFVGYDLFRKIKKAGNLKSSMPLPNLDSESGNLHPDWTLKNNEAWLLKPIIKQAVLVKSNRDSNNKVHWGPLREKTSFNKNSSFDDIADKECYFPQPYYKGDEEYALDELLKGLLKQVLDENSDLYKKLFN